MTVKEIAFSKNKGNQKKENNNKEESKKNTSKFFKNLFIKNYKCFGAGIKVNFNFPNGKEGSGINLLIGENGSGKTTILEALNFLTCGKYIAHNKISVNDFCNINEKIEIVGETDVFKCKSSIDFYKDWYFISNGIIFNAASRKTKESGKIFSSAFTITNNFNLSQDAKYFTRQNKASKSIDSRDKNFENGRIIDGGISSFFFDRNRSRHLYEGTFKTTFNKICEDRNYQFLKEFETKNKDNEIIKLLEEYFKIVMSTKKNIFSEVTNNFANFFDNKSYENLKIDLINILHPFSDAFFTIRKENDFKQILINDLGSGIEIILSLLLLTEIAHSENHNDSIIYLIDEPELHLHPKALSKLGEFFLEQSKDKQIFITTHSPYLYKTLYKKSKILIAKKDNQDKNIVEEIKEENGLFPWSPSWGEINFKAYDMPTIEFHNELYGYLQEKTDLPKLTEFDQELSKNGVKKDKKWIRDGKNGEIKEEVTLHTYIRNSIHHPENTKNLIFTEGELKLSIEEMIYLLERKFNGN